MSDEAKKPAWEDELRAKELAKALKDIAEKGEEDPQCGNCGADVRSGDTFCWKCGNALEGMWLKTCKQCGTIFKTLRPKEREICNKCEGINRKPSSGPFGILRY